MSAPEALVVAASTSPRHTWLWAANETDLARLRQLLVGGWDDIAEEPLVTGIGIGVDAYDTCMHLAPRGVVFEWHPSQHVLDRYGWLDDLVGAANS